VQSNNIKKEEGIHMKCPRCDSDAVRVMTKSPVGDVWEVYVCDTCCFSWRSTEDIHVHDVFKLKPEDICKLQHIPPIPPLKSK
jgi:hypothetical protein